MSPRRAYAITLVVPLATPRTTLASSQRSIRLGREQLHRNVLDAAGRSDRHAAGGGVALHTHLLGNATRPAACGPQELALLDDPLAQLLDAHRVDEPLHAGADLVVAVAVVVEGAQARFDRGQEVFAGRERLEGLRRVRVGAEATGDEHLEAGLDGAVVEGARGRDHAHVVEHGLAAVGGAAREVDLELAGQALRVRVAEQPAGRRFRPRRDVELLLRARAGEVAAHDVADGVAAGLAGGEADRRQQAQDLGRLLELHEVELHVLAGGEVAPAPRVRLGDVGARLELLGGQAAVRHLDPEHLVVAALPLPVDALVQAEDAEHVFVDPAVEVLVDRALVVVELLRDGGVEDSG